MVLPELTIFIPVQYIMTKVYSQNNTIIYTLKK